MPIKSTRPPVLLGLITATRRASDMASIFGNDGKPDALWRLAAWLEAEHRAYHEAYVTACRDQEGGDGEARNHLGLTDEEH